MGPSDPPIQCTARGVPTGPIGLLLWRVLLRLFRLCMTDTKQPNCFTVISGSYVQLDWLLWLLSVATDFVTTRHDRQSVALLQAVPKVVKIWPQYMWLSPGKVTWKWVEHCQS